MKNEPVHDKTCNKTLGTSEDSDQTVHPRIWSESSLIACAFSSLPAIQKDYKLEPLTYWVDVQVNLRLCWSHVLLYELQHET